MTRSNHTMVQLIIPVLLASIGCASVPNESGPSGAPHSTAPEVAPEQAPITPSHTPPPPSQQQQQHYEPPPSDEPVPAAPGAPLPEPPHGVPFGLGESNLPVLCADPLAESKAATACATASQLFARAQPGSLVRACATASCTIAQSVWRRLSDVPSASTVEVCGAEKPLGSALDNCPGGEPVAPWGGMKFVAASAVPRVEETAPPEPLAFPGTFTATPSAGTAPLNVTLAWDVSTLTGGTCTGAGSWSGAKSLKGTLSTTLNASASYTLNCSTAGTPLGTATLSWGAPTKNTDGTALTNLAGYRVIYGTAADALTQTITINNPAATSYAITQLAGATYYFALRAVNAAGAESAPSNTVSKTIATTTATNYSVTRAVQVDAAPVLPNPPTLKTVEQTVYNAIADYSLLAFRRSSTFGTAPLGTPCDQRRAVLDSYYAIPLEVITWSSSARTKYPVARCAQQ